MKGYLCLILLNKRFSESERKLHNLYRNSKGETENSRREIEDVFEYPSLNKIGADLGGKKISHFLSKGRTHDSRSDLNTHILSFLH